MFIKTYGKVFITSGSKGIDGRGYWYDTFLNLIPGYNFKNATFIAKTVTLNSRNGYLPLKNSLQPREIIPRCIKVYPVKGAIMNAVGIPNPGLKKVLDMNFWQQRDTPFLISIMPVSENFNKRLDEIKQIVYLLKKQIFKTTVGLQLNLSCPNTDLPACFFSQFSDIIEYLAILKDLDWFIDLKINVLYPTSQVSRLEPWCDIITCSNTIPFGSFSDKIDWDKYKGLEKFGGGGLSGKPLLPLVLDWIQKVHTLTTIKIKGCGGIMCSKDAVKMALAGAQAIEIGSVKLLRPWRVESIINEFNKL